MFDGPAAPDTSADGAERSAALSGATQPVGITVPDGARAGDRVHFEHGGQRFDTVVPAGYAAGQSFWVNVPAPAPAPDALAPPARSHEPVRTERGDECAQQTADRLDVARRTQQQPAPLPAEWTEHRSTDGRTYYHNPGTHQTQWERPSGTDLITVAQQQPQPTPTRPQPQQQQQLPLLDLSLLEKNKLHAAGKLYVVSKGAHGPGIYTTWEACGVTGHSGARFKAFEWNARSPPGGKRYTSFEACESDILTFLAGSGVPRITGAVALRQQQRSEEAQRERERLAAAEAREEQERVRLERERAAQAAQAWREAATRRAAAEAAERAAARRKSMEAELAAARAAALARMRSTEMAEETSEALEAAYREVLHGWALERDQPKGARSAEAKKRRFAKLRAKQQARATSQAAADGVAAGRCTEAAGDGRSPDLAAALHESERREAALRRQLAASEARVEAERKRARRDKKTVAQRARQAERSNGKAAARKRKAKREDERKRAERKDDERQRKRKLPTGEAFHTGERKHRRLGGGGHGRV